MVPRNSDEPIEWPDNDEDYDIYDLLLNVEEYDLFDELTYNPEDRNAS